MSKTEVISASLRTEVALAPRFLPVAAKNAILIVEFAASDRNFFTRSIHYSMVGSRSCFQVIVRQVRSPTWSNALFLAWSVD